VYEPEVVSIGGGRGWFEIEFPYIGSVLSLHNAYTRGRFLRGEAREWRDTLALHIRAYLNGREDQPEPPLIVGIFGYFKDGRSRPDFDNLHKLVGDAIQAGTRTEANPKGINDKHYLWHDRGWARCAVWKGLKARPDPTLLIKVRWKVETGEEYREYLERGQHGPDI
jgi:hypothetical protein